MSRKNSLKWKSKKLKAEKMPTRWNKIKKNNEIDQEKVAEVEYRQRNIL